MKKKSKDKKVKEKVIQADPERDIFGLYSEKCLKCKHLTDLGKTVDNKQCHYSAGNTDCPARYMFFTQGINMRKAAEALAKAKSSGDTTRMSRIYKKLSGYHKAISDKVIEL